MRIPALGRRMFPWVLRLVLSALLVLLALFPNVPRLLVQLPRSLHPERLVNPSFSGIEVIEDEIRDWLASLSPDGAASMTAVVEAYVRERIAYAFDWDLYRGNINDWPTPEEVWSRRSDDCDGIAIVTASILRRLGVDARLEYNLIHCWVTVPGGATLGGAMPGPTGSSEGGAPRWDALLWDLFRVRTWSDGRLFPWWRVAVALVAAATPWLPSGRRRIRADDRLPGSASIFPRGAASRN